MDPDRFGGELLKILIHKSAGYLSGPVRPEVEEYDAIPIIHHALIIHHCGHDELVVLPPIVSLSDRLFCAVRPQTLAINQAAIGLLYPLPAAVPVHGVVAAAHSGRAAGARLREFLLQIPEIAKSAAWRHIPAI